MPRWGIVCAGDPSTMKHGTPVALVRDVKSGKVFECSSQREAARVMDRLKERAKQRDWNVRYFVTELPDNQGGT